MIRWPRSEFVTVFIVGVPASGKTSLAMRLVRSWKRFKRNQKPIAVYARLRSPGDLDAIVEFVDEASKAVEAKAVSIVLDDATYVFGHDKAAKEAMGRLMRLRHEVPRVKYWQVVIIAHWFRSIPPILRSADVRALTSIDVTWIPTLKEAFPESALWDFLEAWRSWVLQRGIKAGLALIHQIGLEPMIVRWRKPDKDLEPPWLDFNMQMQQNPRVDKG